MYYIGQTQDLSQRLRTHRSDCKLDGSCHSKKLGLDWDCEVLEECDSNELHVAERFYYDFFHEISPEHMVNKVKPLRTDAEYVKENAEKIKEYYANNAEKIKESNKKYYAANREALIKKATETKRKSRHKKLLSKLT
tara:strand:- start:65 stop:475 length:411 start_codon:yes stop_codon:yes gene_type:complete